MATQPDASHPRDRLFRPCARLGLRDPLAVDGLTGPGEEAQDLRARGGRPRLVDRPGCAHARGAAPGAGTLEHPGGARGRRGGPSGAVRRNRDRVVRAVGRTWRGVARQHRTPLSRTTLSDSGTPDRIVTEGPSHPDNWVYSLECGTAGIP